MKNLISLIIILILFSCGQKTPVVDTHSPNTDTTNLFDSIRTTSSKPVPMDTANQIKSESRKVEIACNWALENGWFTNKYIEFKRTDKEDYVFIFQKDGTIDYRTSKGLGRCPVGAFTMKDGKWAKEGQNLTLELRGLKISDYWYWWKIQYRIKKLTADDLKLEVVKIIKQKEINPNLTWNELLKE